MRESGSDEVVEPGQRSILEFMVLDSPDEFCLDPYQAPGPFQGSCEEALDVGAAVLVCLGGNSTARPEPPEMKPLPSVVADVALELGRQSVFISEFLVRGGNTCSPAIDGGFDELAEEGDDGSEGADLFGGRGHD